MKLFSLAIAAALLTPFAAQAAEAPGALAAQRRRVESADYRISGRLVRIDAKGMRTTSGIRIAAHWFPGMLRILFDVVSPADARVHILLDMRPGRESTIQITHPGDKKPSALPFDQWSEGPLGEGFSYEDLLEATYFWAGQEDLGLAKFGTRNCDLLRSTPGASDHSHFAEVKSWLDHSSGFPVHVEKTSKGSGKVKEFTYFGLRQTQGVWSASQVEAKIRGQAGSTLLIIDRGTAKAHLDLREFSPAQLTHF